MFRKAIGFLSLAALLQVHPAVAEDRPTRIGPISPWTMDYAENSCALRRQFGTREHPITFELRQFVPGSGVQVIITGDTLDTVRAPTRLPSTKFLPDLEETENRTAFFAEFVDGANGVILSDSLRPGGYKEDEEHDGLPAPWPDAEREKRLAEITGFSITGGFTQDLEIVTGPLTAAMGAMDTCLDQLLGKWGLDAEAHRSLTSRARLSNFDRLAKEIMSQYPISMVRQGKQGIVRTLVLIDREGRATECRAQFDIPDKEFEQTVCKVMMSRARFEPAIDAAGSPIPSYLFQDVSFRVGPP